MKQMIVLIAMIGLGAAMFQMIAGNDNSVYSEVQSMWQHEAETVQYFP